MRLFLHIPTITSVHVCVNCVAKMFPFFLIVLNVVEFDVKIESRIKFFQTKRNEKPHISIVIESDEKLV